MQTNTETFEERQARELEEFKASQQRAAEERKRREEIRERQNREYQAFEEQKLQEIQEAYHPTGNFNEEIAKLIFFKAWEDGHSCGYHEVENYISMYEDFVEDILTAANK